MNKSIIEKNSIKQMFRMPVKTVGFFIMIMATGFLLSLAAGMFVKTTANIRSYQQMFKTIGTVSQTPSSMSRELIWDAEAKNYMIVQRPEYDKFITADDLDFDGADYVIPPEKRNYYASYSPEYYTIFSHELRYVGAPPICHPIVEFSPKEDCVPDHSVRIKVTDVLYGHVSLNPSVMWFCDHETKDPPKLYKDKKYIAKLKTGQLVHGELADSEVPENKRKVTREYYPEPLVINQFDVSGSSISGEEESAPYYEISDGFYDTPVGKKYTNYARGLEMRYHTFPVTGTNSTDLLLPFYNTNVYIAEGRDISGEAYADGLNECLISKDFAQNNDLTIGDSVKVNLLFTNCDKAAEENYLSWGGGSFDFTMLIKDGEIPRVFESKDYTVAGIYDSSKYGDGDPMYQLASDEMIVPLRSIEHKDKNILKYGPVNDFTSSFQIPNGTIDKYMEKWEAFGYDNVNITFYDMGYTKLEKGMKNMRFMAIVFGMSGIVLGAVLLIFYSRMFIVGQKVRITIERCMGLTVTECRRSLLLGAMLVLIIGSLAGCISGTLFSGTISAYDMGREIYDMTYTAGRVTVLEDIDVPALSVMTVFLTGLVCELLILSAGYGILYNDVKKLLKQEPLYLIDDINRE